MQFFYQVVRLAICHYKLFEKYILTNKILSKSLLTLTKSNNLILTISVNCLVRLQNILHFTFKNYN